MTLLATWTTRGALAALDGIAPRGQHWAMFLAPVAPLSARVVTIPNGARGISATLRQMRDYVREYRKNPEIISAARSIVFAVPQKDEFSEVGAVFEWVRDMVRYVRDVHEIETLATPDKTLITRAGDCDDQTTLLAALLESIGYPTRFVVTGYQVRDVFEHVHLQVFAGAQWIDCDPTESESLGFSPPSPISTMIEKV